MLIKLLVSTCLLVGLYLRLATAGYCYETYTYVSTCTRSKRYTTSCGLWGWGRCHRYKYVTYTCTKTGTRKVCCSGYMGSNCNTPICYGLTLCYNGGTCVSPNNCRCAAGFTGSQCKSDINECELRTSGCAEKCTNNFGSFTCSCIRDGYVIGSNKKSCVDADECQLGLSDCEHICSNTEGSYTCSCRPGYDLALNMRSCEDIDECSSGQSNCDHYCTNNIGSFTCSCRSGYMLQADGKTCEDINECSDTTLCDQICVEVKGSYRCQCENGFRLQTDGRTCADVDECEEDISRCSHTCDNTIGSFICGCHEGYFFSDDGKKCINIDDCVNSPCQNGGSCIDGVSSFLCLCGPGFTGELCQSDVDECSFINGGCQDTCTNTKGSFLCSCEGNRTLESDGKSCTGGTEISSTVFDRHQIPRQLLPRGCATVLLTSCTDGKDIDVLLSSTSNWYRLKKDRHTIFTYGIVFVEMNSLSLPMSLNGAEVKQYENEFSISVNVALYNVNDSEALGDQRTVDCFSYEFTPKDIYDFVSHGSFLGTLFSMVKVTLPDWLDLFPLNISVLQVQDLRTELIYGSQVENILWCQGAPVLPDHLYSVFQFDSTFALSIYSKDIVIPKPLDGNKFCLIVDTCQNYGGTIFLMVPQESETILTELDVFETLYRQEKLLIKPRGIGVSVVKGINVHDSQKELQLWNGDVSFTYPLFERADVWIGGDFTWRPDSIAAGGSADFYISVPRPDRVLTAMYIDEWNVLFRAKGGLTLTLMLELFGDVYEISFSDLVTANVDMYMSVGGTKKRSWCGDISNPPGLFFSGRIDINPFQNVPILEDWVVEVPNTLYAFVTTALDSADINENTNSILRNLLDLNKSIDRVNNHLQSTLQSLGSTLGNKSMNAMTEIQNDVGIFQSTLLEYVKTIPEGGLDGISEAVTELWKQVINIENHLMRFEDITAFPINIAAESFISLMKSEMVEIKSTISDGIKDISKQLHSLIKDISGFGLKYTTSVKLFGLKILGIDIEIVYSKSGLMKCSRFEKVMMLLEGEPALRFIGRVSVEERLNFFINVEKGGGFGCAFGLTTNNVIVQYNVYVNIIGIRTTADLFISRSGLHLYIEGNVWNIFLAQIDISAEVGKEWHQMTFTLQGRFVAKAKRKRQTQTDSSSFQSSYLDGLTKAVSFIANEADKRISQAQNVLSIAQSGLTIAQRWLRDKKEDVRKAHTAFDKAVAALDRAHAKLEEAKGPFKIAIEKLNRAQKDVDNLCRIRSCRQICIPGVKLKWCKGWIPFPCLKFTRCMISFPDPLCVLANILCAAVRAIAFLALEAAKLFVRIPMLALDAAKAVVSVAKFAVDKSRVVLTLAEGALELGALALEASNGVLELAKISLEAVKIAIKAAAKVLEFVIQFGLKSILDVRNCGFKIEVSTTDLPVFDVFCDVNAFRLGWNTIRLRINFRNVLQTIWQAAKATIDHLIKLVFGRKRRDIAFETSTNIHRLFRYIRQSEQDPTNPSLEFLNQTIDIVSIITGFNESVTNDYDNRVLLFKQKCEKMNLTLAFLNKIGQSLFEVTNDTKSAIDESSVSEFEDFNMDDLVQNMTLENANVSTEYAFKDYNLTKDELEQTLAETKNNASTDPYITEILAVKDLSKSMIEKEIDAMDHSALLDNWILLMENETKSFFSENDCVEFRDCILYATAEIYDLYIEDDHPNVTEIQQAVNELEDMFIDIIQNTSQNVIRIYNLSVSISLNLKLLNELNVFCSTPPQFHSALENTTVVRGHSVSLKCDAFGNPPPRFWWLKNDELMSGISDNILVIPNATDGDKAMYKCIAGNVVANLTSSEAFLHLEERREAEPVDKITESVDKITHEEIIIECYIVTFVYVGVNIILVTIQISLIERKYNCMVIDNLWMLVYKIVGPTMTLLMLAIACQIALYKLGGLKCNIIEGMLTPVGVMALIEVATIGAMVVYVNKKGKWIVSWKAKFTPETSGTDKSEKNGEWVDAGDKTAECPSKDYANTEFWTVKDGKQTDLEASTFDIICADCDGESQDTKF